MNRIFAFFFMLLFACWAQAALAGQAQDTLKVSVDEVLSVLRDSRQGDPGRTARLAQAVGRVFDPEELASRTLASHWQDFSPEEQKRFTAAFVKLLQNTYLRRLETYTNESVVFLEEASLAENRAEVSTKVVTASKEIPIVYRLIKKSDWKVYDVVIEGVSLVQNYRNQFTQILTKESPSQLIGRLEAMASAG
jgi:phospholipid transport system substrate-binding protein